ncbi:four-carbon acid sugar kinase family protein [Chelativorans alearense]|uniref:four-carbon acid sugar kinase family protein n=1 Tax=Chelativorans alearense TaxID=2681495 RepID=UPI0013D4AA70|nr:four-carbon acid sugar kinase family protein [Chelativorans alearense]
MGVRLAVIADDLTGALDTSAPFAARGLSVRVALGIEALKTALQGNPEIVAVNTASRGLSPEAAAGRAAEAAEHILGHGRPAVVLKKIDSRLKGNIAVEAVAVAEIFGFARAVAAPAVPDQGRWTVEGAVIGRGVEHRIPVAALFDGAGLAVDVADAKHDRDLLDIAAGTDWSQTLAIGGRGLGQAFAAMLEAERRPSSAPMPRSGAVVFAFGSRDPITEAQIAHLKAARADLMVVTAPDGRLPRIDNPRLPLLLHCTGGMTARPDEVAAQFAEGVVRLVRQVRPDLLALGGGDTALAVCTALGAGVAVPLGEAAPGLPWFELTGETGVVLPCVVKSGGFGRVDVLSGLLAERSADIAGTLRSREREWTGR